MNWVSAFDVISFLAVLAALAIVGRGWKRALRRDARWVLAGILVLTALHGLSNTLEWSGITDVLDPYEDFVEILLPVLWGCFFYAVLQEGVERDLRASAETLRRERDLVSRIMETSPAGIVMVNREGQITFANPRAEQVLGLTKDELVRRTYNDPAWRITTYDGTTFPDADLPFQRVATRGRPVFDVRHAIVWPDGQRVLLSINAAPLFDEAGQVDGMVAIVEDVTDRVRTQQALKENEERYRALFERTNDAVFILSLGGVHLVVNQRAADLLGYAPDELVGMSIREVIVPAEIEQGLQRLAELLAGQTLPVYERTFRHKDGTEIPVEVNAALVYDAAGRPLHVQSIVRDIAERKRAEQALRESMEQLKEAQARLIRSAKMAAVGQLAAGVAHELNNPLTSMLGFAEIVLQEIDQDAPYRADLETIISEGRRARQIVLNLLDFSRQRKPLRQPVDLNDILRKTLAVVHPHLQARGVTVRQSFEQDIGPLSLDTGQMQQVFLNLITNAVQAMPEGGHLTIETRRVDDQVSVSISDTGEGISPEDEGHIFDPFYTTKTSGTGLGLSVSLGIVEEHGGQITVESAPGGGCTFTVWLPAA